MIVEPNGPQPSVDSAATPPCAAYTGAPSALLRSSAPCWRPPPRVASKPPPELATASPGRICGEPFNGHTYCAVALRSGVSARRMAVDPTSASRRVERMIVDGARRTPRAQAVDDALEQPS